MGNEMKPALLNALHLVMTALAGAAIISPSALGSPGPTGHWLSPYGDLQAAIDAAGPMDTLRLARGTYEATPEAFEESICGNCVDPATPVRATAGFRVHGKPLVIIGEDAESTVLKTNAGYGVFFDGSFGSKITNVTVTGGVRDVDGNATDAAIVAKNGRVTVERVRIVGNTDRVDTVVVGIGGVFGREGSEIFVLNNVIRDNGWDGVALYRGSSAVIADNVIDGGRGAGIGITWDASAVVLRNNVSGYWKGIGAFGDTWVTARNNAVFDNLGWGIIATGRTHMEVTNNVIHHNGNCGFAVWEETARGVLRNNIITANGWKEEWVCPCVGVWMAASVEDFKVMFNNIWNNAAGEYESVPDQTGKSGNISADPAFAGDHIFALRPGSPSIDAGDSTIVDADGTRSDMGVFGGPLARKPATAE
jgi:hypothetical protein